MPFLHFVPLSDLKYLTASKKPVSLYCFLCLSKAHLRSAAAHYQIVCLWLKHCGWELQMTESVRKPSSAKAREPPKYSAVTALGKGKVVEQNINRSRHCVAWRKLL